jgi:hypothetical protein
VLSYFFSLLTYFLSPSTFLGRYGDGMAVLSV